MSGPGPGPSSQIISPGAVCSVVWLCSTACWTSVLFLARFAICYQLEHAHTPVEFFSFQDLGFSSSSAQLSAQSASQCTRSADGQPEVPGMVNVGFLWVLSRLWSTRVHSSSSLSSGHRPRMQSRFCRQDRTTVYRPWGQRKSWTPCSGVIRNFKMATIEH